jgi:NAD+ synthase (glutamine-hydrolysing)
MGPPLALASRKGDSAYFVTHGMLAGQSARSAGRRARDGPLTGPTLRDNRSVTSPPVLRLALCQMDPTVGDIATNEAAIAAGIAAARKAGAHIVTFGELAVTGYPPEDLLYQEQFLRDARAALERLATATQDIVAVVGFPEHAEKVYNGAAILANGRIAGICRKMHLPNYGVFDEQRYFARGLRPSMIELGGHRLGITVCEDVWLAGVPSSALALAGAALIINVSASPYHAGKGLEREAMIGERARDYGTAFAFCALVGGQDELVFDGHSFVVDAQGMLLARATQFAEAMLLCDIPLPAREPASPAPDIELLAQLEWPHVSATRSTQPQIATLLAPREAEVYAALECGLHDYVLKNGFGNVVLGLSGGIDSALVAAIAADALGAERVTAVVMPSEFSSAATQDDARALATTLGISLLELPIASAMVSYEDLLAPAFDGRARDITEENLQARIRGTLLMALSNKFGWLVLTTGNKSEMSVGYSTLYGDSAGGFAVIKDIEKTLVYALARWRNERGAPIAASILERAPTAELRHGQRDDDSLPAYDVLDAILRGYVEQNAGRDELLARGLPPDAIDRVIGLVDRAEYKRRQAPPGIKITERAFGRDRRMPITNRYRA